MLRKRLIGLLPVRDGIVVQSFRFARYLPVGLPEICAEFLNRWGIDEIILIDIGASAAGRSIDPAIVDRTARLCSVPLAVGGGLQSVAAARDLLTAGADKIVVNTAAVADPALVSRLAESFGEQCVVVAIDAVRLGYGQMTVRTANGLHPSRRSPDYWLRELQDAGAGEVLVQSVDRDGMRDGLDLELARTLAAFARIPLILTGGTGHPGHVLDALAINGIQAVAVGNLLAHTEHSVTALKSWLRRAGCDVRLDTTFDYSRYDLDSRGRLLRLNDSAIELPRFAEQNVAR
jgi:cyclase